MNATLSSFDLFGSSKPFLPPTWTTTDDRVRGGASQSYLTALPSNCARFHGHLDTTTLGGAGFASQFSPPEIFGLNGNDKEKKKDCWDLSSYDGIEIEIWKGDGKTYTFILKDEEQTEKREDGREKAGINWEIEFTGGGESDDERVKEKEGTKVWVPWGDFKATYRGKEKKDAGELKTREVRRVGLMMRSYFGKQEGDFSVELKAIRARKQTTEEKDAEVVQPSQKPISNEESENNQQNGGQQSSGMIAWLSRMCKLS